MSYSIVMQFMVCLIMLNFIFLWMDIKVPPRKVMVCAFIGMLTDILPVAAANLVIDERYLARLWIYRLFLFPLPICSIVYYIAIRKLLNFSPTRALIAVRYQLLLSYISTTFYLFLNDLLCRILVINSKPGQFFPPDYLSFIITIAVMIIMLEIMEKYLKKTQNHLIVPPSYSDTNITKRFIKMFLSACAVYSVVAFFRINWIPQLSNPINFTTGLIYFLITAGIVLYLLLITSQLRGRLAEWEMQATGTYISSLLHTNQEFRAIKHDFYNVLQGYGGYLAIEDYEGLEKYHNKLFSTTKQAGDFLSVIEILRSRIAVYSLLEAMSKKAKKVNVSFSINQVCDVTDIVLDDIDLCRVLGIVIDNAIEEAQLSERRQVNISFERKDINTVVLIISNTTKGDVDLKQIFKEGFTTKEDHAGIGLAKALHLLNSYEHCSLRANYHDNQFSIFLILRT